MEIDENKLWFCERQGLADIYKKWDPAWDKYFEEHERLKKEGLSLQEYVIDPIEYKKLLESMGLDQGTVNIND